MNETFAEPFLQVHELCRASNLMFQPKVVVNPYASIRNFSDSITGKVTPESFNQMSEIQKEEIYEKIPFPIKVLAGENIAMAMIFKNSLDEKYGEGEYKFVSVGTSPSCVAKAMEYMGEDVVYLPMTFSKGTVTKSWLDNTPYKDMYKFYMTKQGLSNTRLKKEDKIAVVCDYVSTGRSLSLANYMLTNTFGLDPKRVKTVTMNSIIMEAEDLTPEEKEKYLQDMLKNEKIGDYSDVPHFDFLNKTPLITGEIKNTKDLIHKFENHTGQFSNSHNFALLMLLEKYHLYEKSPA